MAMTPFPHRYAAHLTGGPDGHARMTAPGVLPLATAPPAEFGGPGDAWSPEQLLLASVQSCFLFTLRAVAQHSRLSFTALDVDVDGTVDRHDGVTRFTAIALHARLTVPAGTDRSRALQVLAKSERACLIAASLSTPVVLDAEIVEAQPIAAIPADPEPALAR
jgi:organic hydroperoxide reductase OsmC/OhrA